MKMPDLGMCRHPLAALVVLQSVALAAVGCRSREREFDASTGYDDSAAARIQYDGVQKQLSTIEEMGFAPDYAAKWSPEDRRAIAAVWEHFRAGAVVSLGRTDAFPRYKVEALSPRTFKVTLLWAGVRTDGTGRLATPGMAELWCAFTFEPGVGDRVRVTRVPPEDIVAAGATQCGP